MRRSGNIKIPLTRFSKKTGQKNEKNEDEEMARVYKEFTETFSNTTPTSQSWVRGGVVNPASKPNEGSESSKMYKPTSKFNSIDETKERPNNSTKSNKPTFIAKNKAPAKKSNLESFKEELKKMQEQREERHQLKHRLQQESIEARAKVMKREGLPFDPSFFKSDLFSLDYTENENDTSTTNIFLGNLSPKTSEQGLCELFGRYGPLASVKIMWPRNEEQKAVGRNCGFVAFMNRFDSERAMTNLRGKSFHNFELKLGWGKSITVPIYPIYIPPKLLDLTKPPLPSGLPFNAQPRSWLESRDEKIPRIPFDTEQMSKDELEVLLQDCVVKVVVPTDRSVVATIHRLIEFVVYYGSQFESAIMHKEYKNPMFRFLFEFQCPEHVYYRWRLWSLLHGESVNNWSTNEFKMFENGSWWKPPPMNLFTGGMSEDLIEYDDLTYPTDKEPVDETSDPVVQDTTPKLTEAQRLRLIKMVLKLEPSQSAIADVMVWCLEHAECSEDIVRIIQDSMNPNSELNNDTTDKEQPPSLTVSRLVARLFLASDVLYNSGAKAAKAAFYRKSLESSLPTIFKFLHEYYKSLEGKVKSEQFKQKVLLCFRAWEDWAIYSKDFLIQLQNVFLGLLNPNLKHQNSLDGEELPKSHFSENNKSQTCLLPTLVNYDLDESADVDGSPLEEHIFTKSNEKLKPKPKIEQRAQLFLPSKWESVEPNDVAKDAITAATLSRWEKEDHCNFNRKSSSSSHRSSEKETPRSKHKSSSTSSKSKNISPKKKDDVSSAYEDLDGTPLEEMGFTLVAYDDRDVNSPPPA